MRSAAAGLGEVTLGEKTSAGLANIRGGLTLVLDARWMLSAAGLSFALRLRAAGREPSSQRAGAWRRAGGRAGTRPGDGREPSPASRGAGQSKANTSRSSARVLWMILREYALVNVPAVNARSDFRSLLSVHLALSRNLRSRLINGSRRATPAAPDLLRAADELQLVEMRLLQKAIGAES